MGVKLMPSSKRSGLEKAIYQVEEAIKKRQIDASTTRTTLEHLHSLLNETQSDDHSPGEAETVPTADRSTNAKDAVLPSHDDHLAIEGVENPLQLLAHASDLRITSPHNVDTPGSKINGSEQSAFLDVHHFFLPMKASLDQGPGLDPIDVGLVTISEADMLVQ